MRRVMSVSFRPTAARSATAYHEAGHAVMAWKLGIALKKVTIVPDEDSAGSCYHAKIVRGRYPECDDSPHTRIRMEKLAMVSLAGPVAQRLYSPRSIRHSHSSSDRKKARDVAFCVNDSAETATAFLKWLDLRVQQILRSPVWTLVLQALAEELLRCETLSGREASELIRRNFARDSLSKRALVATGLAGRLPFLPRPADSATNPRSGLFIHRPSPATIKCG